MKCLTICQPWAWALIHGEKRIENRSWATDYCGWLGIHAGKSRDWLFDKEHGDKLNDGTISPPESGLVFGAIIGIAHLVGCELIEHLNVDDPYAEGPWCWVFDDVFPIDPIEYPGKPSLWTPNNSVESQLLDAVRTAATGLENG